MDWNAQIKISCPSNTSESEQAKRGNKNSNPTKQQPKWTSRETRSTTQGGKGSPGHKSNCETMH